MKEYYFIGIKGSGMSALACILHDLGHKVSGSDVDKYFFTEDELVKRNITIKVFDKNNVEDNVIVIAGNSFNNEHEEVKVALEKELEFYRYHQFLGELIKKHKSVGISGTHGKTTITSLISHLFQDEKVLYLIGDGRGAAKKGGEYFIFEACEYRDHFLNYKPYYTIVSNIDWDHPDYFKDINQTIESFQNYINDSEVTLVCGDNDNSKNLNHNNKYTYGLKEDNYFRATNILVGDNTSFDMYINNKFYGNFTINLFGEHQVQNAVVALAIAYLEDLPVDSIKNHLLSFTGARRRFDVTTFNDQIIIDDYAHHPTEIEATINSARAKYPNREVIAIFEPITYSRVENYKKDFAEKLKLADKAYIVPIYASAREKNIHNITIKDLENQMENTKVLTYEDLEILKEHKDAVLLFMGVNINTYIAKYKSL